MTGVHKALIGAACLSAVVSLESCRRAAETSSAGSPVGDDMKGVAKDTEKTARDIGRATVDLAAKAGERVEESTNEVGASGDDAWITTKVKSELTAQGLDPLRVHVDTAAKVVTLSGTVATAADGRKAISLAKAVKGVAGVEDHLFVKPNSR